MDFADIVAAPAVQTLAKRVERDEVSSCTGVSSAAQSFFAALFQRLFPGYTVVLVADNRRTQEVFEQDVVTWLKLLTTDAAVVPARVLFHPEWEVLPHEDRLPHADVISERLETLIALAHSAEAAAAESQCIVTNVAALLQPTLAPGALRTRLKRLRRGDRLDPLDLVEWLEDQGYEPESQVNSKGQLSLRGGILDVFPLTSPWPVRLEFFGDELDSLRFFDPVSQISREAINETTISPGGELGILRQATRTEQPGDEQGGDPIVGSLLDHLPEKTLWLLAEPEILTARAREYASEQGGNASLFVPWEELQSHIRQRKHRLIELTEVQQAALAEGDEVEARAAAVFNAECVSLDVFRPLKGAGAGPEVAEVQRREFFNQMHRWLRQGLQVHVICNNEGERQRFEEVWAEQGFGMIQRADGVSPADQSSTTESKSAGGHSTESSFPLTPALSPGEREKLSAPHDATDAAKQDSRSSASPSPRGEGWGEGKRGVRLQGKPPKAGELETPQPSSAFAASQDACPTLHIGTLSRGFLWEAARMVVVTDAEVFGRSKIQRPRRLKAAHAQATRSALEIDFADLEEGDYVVHLQHGIGRYLGLEAMPSGAGGRKSALTEQSSTATECLAIEYAPSDPTQPPPKLYVPVSEAHLVSKYVGAGKARPPLNTLGGTRWRKAKEHAERAVRDVAADMLAIQAVRESQPGHAFEADSRWQQEFEDAFLFEETPDQVQAIGEAKLDMERARPMDRLICGDVGFGKTEVAIRAGFKAVMGGKQVAVLVPTTVLAQQHYNTFRDRMADYPIRVELLSRFRTRRQQQQVLRDLAAGSVDIVVGTHRLVQPDIVFKDLGLVVVDEEQRFGVLHKERLKQLRTMVDVLTLSATPIPRTLYLALCGARDMSTIQTPPQDRLPVETIVSPYDERLIRDAIQRELNRGGQVFFLHNRVMTIETMARKLENLVPHARIVVGHGQMHADDLEEVMTKFVNGEADILLSTTIIESGLDIPNANTIIIDRADRFGLSDLYQLRGRVGRYKHQAYAYLLIPRHAGLLSEARKRITAIRQYATLGSGFKIAMRDLEIRGAGNLLGAEQSGHITAVGFDLYCQLLKQSVSVLKGEKVKPRVNVEVSLDFLAVGMGTSDDGKTREHAHVATAGLPMRYVPDSRQRIEIYRKLAECDEAAAVTRLAEVIRDRFGPPPPAVALLLQLAEIKVLASERGVSRIESEDERLMLTRLGDLIMAGGKFPRLTKRDAKGRLKEIKKLLLSLQQGPR